jgi:hypothetical protein
MDIEKYPGSGANTVNFGHVKNPQQVKFLDAKRVENSTDGGVGPDLIYRDPWGNPYVISMDLSEDEKCLDAYYSLQAVSQNNGATGFNGLVNPTDSSGNGNNFALSGGVMVWSLGPDGKIGSSGGLIGKANLNFNKDNILSWK